MLNGCSRAYSAVILFEGSIYNILSSKSKAKLFSYCINVETDTYFYFKIRQNTGGLFDKLSIYFNAFQLVTNFKFSGEGFPNKLIKIFINLIFQELF